MSAFGARGWECRLVSRLRSAFCFAAVWSPSARTRRGNTGLWRECIGRIHITHPGALTPPHGPPTRKHGGNGTVGAPSSVETPRHVVGMAQQFRASSARRRRARLAARGAPARDLGGGRAPTGGQMLKAEARRQPCASSARLPRGKLAARGAHALVLGGGRAPARGQTFKAEARRQPCASSAWRPRAILAARGVPALVLGGGRAPAGGQMWRAEARRQPCARSARRPRAILAVRGVPALVFGGGRAPTGSQALRAADFRAQLQPSVIFYGFDRADGVENSNAFRLAAPHGAKLAG